MTIKTFDPTKVTWRLVQTQMTLVFILVLFFLIGLIRLDWVSSCGWDRALLVSGISSALFLLKLFGGLGRLLLLGFSFLRPSLKLFSPKVLCCLNLRLNRGGVPHLVVLVVMLINIAADKGLHFGFGLSLRCSLDQKVLSMQFSAFFIYPKPNWWPEAFMEVLA